MGNLIVMSPARTPVPSREAIVGRSADILFFTGVRYYRMEDAVPASPPMAKRIRSPEQRLAAKMRRSARRMELQA